MRATVDRAHVHYVVGVLFEEGNARDEASMHDENVFGMCGRGRVDCSGAGCERDVGD